VSKSPLSVKSMLGIVAVLAAIGAIAIQATSGSAQTAPKTLHLLGHSQKKVGFFPKHKPRQGDQFGFGDSITGDDTGIDRGVCTFIGGQSVCSVQASLSKGTLSLQGFISEKVQNQQIAVVGGTGAYNGASGTAVATQVNKSTTDISITFQ
jgi:hypothetical protein